MIYFCDIRKDAKAQVERLLDRVNRVGRINTDYWHEVEPAYGSEEYCKKYNF